MPYLVESTLSKLGFINQKIINMQEQAGIHQEAGTQQETNTRAPVFLVSRGPEVQRGGEEYNETWTAPLNLNTLRRHANGIDARGRSAPSSFLDLVREHEERSEAPTRGTKAGAYEDPSLARQDLESELGALKLSDEHTFTDDTLGERVDAWEDHMMFAMAKADTYSEELEAPVQETVSSTRSNHEPPVRSCPTTFPFPEAHAAPAPRSSRASSQGSSSVVTKCVLNHTLQEFSAELRKTLTTLRDPGPITTPVTPATSSPTGGNPLFRSNARMAATGLLTGLTHTMGTPAGPTPMVGLCSPAYAGRSPFVP